MDIHCQPSVGYLTNLAGRLLIRELERHLGPLGLAPAYMPVLMALADGPRPQKALAEEARVEQATMTATLNRMQRDGLVERRPNPQDGRSSLVALTATASEKLPQIRAITASINALVLEQMTLDERGQFYALMGKIIAVLEAQDNAARTERG